MSLKKLNDKTIDRLYKKYGFLDEEGYLVGTNDPKFLKLQSRIEELSQKIDLTEDEEREAAELVVVNKSYMKELKQYVIDIELHDGEEEQYFEDDDEDFVVPDGEHEDEYSDNLSYDSGEETEE